MVKNRKPGRRNVANMTDTPSQETGRRKFVNPPINELVVSMFHLPILELKAQHIGLYWSRIRDRYPLCEQQPFVMAPNQNPFIEAPGEFLPLPRFWFFSNQHPTLIQIQRNAFMFNWRRVPNLPSGEYPHYEGVVQDFWRELQGYEEFIREEVGAKLDVVQRCELGYVNFIAPNEFFPDVTRAAAVLPSLSSLESLAANGRTLNGLNATITYVLTPNLAVDLTIRLGRRADTNEVALVLDIKAHGAPSDLSVQGAREWYESAHDATYKLFLDATAQELQEKIWKPR
jgi:uncharacterized protein (TIGR04255 family)